MIEATQQLLCEIENFLARAGMAETTFGQKSVRDTKLIQRLRSGGSVTLRTAEKVRRFMTDYQPHATGSSNRAA